MRRFLTIVLLIIAFAVLVTVPFYIWGVARFVTFGNQEKAITTFLLASLELLGLLISTAIVVFILSQYIRYRRPYRLVFDAFSNESALANNENTPLNLSILAKERLVRQFKIIFNELKVYSDKESKDFEAFIADELYIEEDLSENDIELFVDADQIKKSGMIEDLKDVFKILTDPEDINLINLVGEIAPKEVTPIMKFIEAMFPPHVIKATGFLQRKSDKTDRVGITFDFVDLGNQRNLLVRTLWHSPDNKEDSADPQPPAQSNTANETVTNSATDNYIDLLSPAMHWLALSFWEQKLLSHVPFINRVITVYEKRRRARILYLFGSLYFENANRFQAYKSFFHQLAVEHLRQASSTDSNWCLPYLYLANLYSFKATEKKEEVREKLLNEALRLYDEALKHTNAIKYTDARTCYRQRIILAKALAGLASEKGPLIDKAKQEIQYLISQDPAKFNPKRADCAYYLYNLAIWYEMAYDNFAGVPNAREEARRYLAYSLARSKSLWDKKYLIVHFKSMDQEDFLDVLKEELDKKLKEKCELVELVGESFKTEIAEVLEKAHCRLRQ